jgi:hypothetical protein
MGALKSTLLIREEDGLVVRSLNWGGRRGYGEQGLGKQDLRINPASQVI